MRRQVKRHVCAPGPLNAPQPARVRADARGRPIVVAGEPVKAVDNDWLGEDGWWLEDELHRRYYEVTTVAERDVVVFRDLDAGGWFEQRA
jgi:hypothetical protein